MYVKMFIVFMLLVIVGSLGSAMFFMLKDKGDSNRTVQALTFRISLSIIAFLILMGSYYLGYIEPNKNVPF